MVKEKYELVICEKPNASLKVAEALADKKVEKKVNNKVPYYEITHNGRKIVIGCAVGHLYGLAEKDKKGWTYPVFSSEWQPTYLIDRGAKFTKAYLDTLTKLCKDADDIYNFCDVDTEGELIFWNILRFVCKRKDAKRAYFSTLTKDELIKAYEEVKPHINFGLASAGETRHELDWLWGINLSRALTLSVRSATGMFKLLSSGRVQGPALKTLYDREIEIKNFKSDPYWEIELKGEANKEEISAWHEQDKFWKKKEADEAIKKTKGKKAIVKSVEKKETKQPPLTPFDLTTLQMEAYRTLNISPKNTLEIAQNLYTGGFISYPRTSSQKLPESIGYVKILKSLSKKFPEANELLKKKDLKPSEGKKTDPAHPCFDDNAELVLNPHGKLKIKKLIDNLEWTFDKNYKSFYSFPKKVIKVLAYDGKSIVSAPITKIWKTPYNKKMLEIYCSNGSVIRTTSNHRFYTITNNGFEYVEAENLYKNYFIASLPNSITQKSSNNKIIITEKDFINTYDKGQKNRIYNYLKNKNNFKVKPTEVQTLEKLKALNILPLKYGTKEAELLSKLVAFIFGDGHLDYEKAGDYRSKYPCSVFIAERVDLEKIKSDLLSIGIKINARIKDATSTNKIQVLQVRNSILNRLLIALGAPIGDKVANNFSIPRWILKEDKNIKRAFLSTYFGNECSKPRSHYKNKRDIKSLQIQIDKIIIFKKSALNFYSQIKYILEKDFSIYAFEIKQKIRKVARSKDNNLTCTTTLYINNKRDNLLKFFLEIGFNYCAYKEKLAKKAIAYLILRNNLIQERIAKKELAKQLRSAGESYSIISDKIGVSESTIKGWINYYKSDKELHVSTQLSKFNDFDFYVGNESWICINKIIEVNGPKYVYDVEVEKYHTFFVNGFLVHNCVYPTGEIPKSEGKEAGLYELIVRRFFVCFGEDALRETMTVEIDVNDEIFIAKGTRTKIEGWHKLYGTFLDLKEEELPDVKEKQELKVKEIILYDKETQPPKRYTEASIIKELERKNLGTKSTRASIIDSLSQRNYIKDKSIVVTDLGMKTVETLEKYCPEILDEALTRKFEEEMEEILEEKKKPEEILDNAKNVLTKLLNNFKKHEKEIGKELGEATIETREQENTIGKCPKCKEGTLKIMYSKKNKSKFIACNKYPECNTTFGLPGNALIKNTDLVCAECSYPKIMVIKRGRRPQTICINNECPSKKLTPEEEKLSKEERVCSKCGKGKMVLRKSVYGSFLACNQYPKCRNIERINGNKKE